jgi:hypothetical protein
MALYVLELEPVSKTYAVTGIFHGQVKLTVATRSRST